MSINTEIGGATANSYVSVASADAYFDARINSSNWTDISLNTTSTAATTAKESYLKQATREIDYNLRFQDAKYEDVPIGNENYQALEFPRRSNTDDNGDKIIPEDVKFATYEQALWLTERGGKRTDSNGVVTQPQTIGDNAIQYINPWVNRQVSTVNNYPWQRSKF
jgi:hypothetical protein